MEGQTGRATVNMDPATMRAVIKYVYTGAVNEITGVEMEKLFKAAHICMLTGLQKMCQDVLLADVTLDNAIQMMALGHLYDVVDLKENAKKIFLDAGLIRSTFYLYSHRTSITLQRCRVILTKMLVLNTYIEQSS